MSLVKAHWLIAGIAGGVALLVPWQLLKGVNQPAPLPIKFAATVIGLRPVPGLDAALLTPVFSVGRAPFGASDSTLGLAAGVAPPAPPPPLPKLVGIALAGRGRGVALVRQADGQTRNLRPGEAADGWRLIGIARASATFRLGGSTQILTLDFGNKPNGLASNAPIPLPPPPFANTPFALPSQTNSPQTDPTGSYR